jgi:NAD(P)-dependent dehydrogenase (short-subunit alcohol dehydrogenase family)
MTDSSPTDPPGGSSAGDEPFGATDFTPGPLDDLRGKVAVVTGGASGIGLALARAFAAEGMRLVLADIEELALIGAVNDLKAEGVEAIGVRTDVTSYESVEALADKTFETYGAVHVLCNNAGVGPPSAKVWETTPNDWRWTFSVNVFGVAHGVQAFVPRMLASGEPGIVINTSSPDGPIAPMPQASVYAATKASVTVLTECLAAQLDAEDAPVRAAVFYPSGKGLLETGLWTSDRNRPPELERERPRETPAMTVESLRKMAEDAGRELPIQPLDDLATLVVEGIRDGSFIMLLPDERTEATLRGRLEKILRHENPTEMHDLRL